ncbi:serine/threonine-protein kinase [Anabaenopsis elenkinii]|uniref:non-specific serine/threonine protein kinase n=1 Tax=Anabaenopsis elenkinii CCIBt3563 TaxID=2779889 RepID=A0A7S6RDY2_9CYAN|nr:GUN4 domain-containing protein [Anabaenopsis elenkinii CCIBt3563]
MTQICCLNPECDNPSVTEDTKFCPSCGIPLVVLRKRYQPLKPLGGGGFAKTYLAVDIDKLNSECVIKQLAPQTQGTAGLQKATALFLQEAQQLQQLGEHPQIPALLAYFAEDNRLYLVQQFIEGENLLTELANQGIFNEAKIRELLQDVLPVLQVIHSQEIIHRDIKPENIMRRRSDGKLILIDFGASKQLQGTVKTGTNIGTFGYSAVEQMQDGRVYPSSDLYSIGATCFHLLTGIHPWELWREDGYGWVKQWRNYVKQAVTLELGQILDKLLHKDAQFRYQSAEEVLQDLNSVPIPPTVALGKPQVSLPTQIIKPSPPRGRLQIAGLVLGGFLIVLLGESLFRNSPTPTPETQTIAEPKPIVKPELISSVGMDYGRLQDLLAAGRWKEADSETRQVMSVVGKPKKPGVLDKQSISNFPCQDLRTIDQLWLKNSNGRFGFSVQKRIYESLGGTTDYNREIFLALGDTVGWRKGINWLFIRDMIFDITAPEGHLPVGVFYYGSVWWDSEEGEGRILSFASRLANCNISRFQ